MSSYSALPDNTPLLVGVGAAMQKEEDPRRALAPLELMIRALQNAERDAGVSGLLREADSVQVPRGFWEYGDPGRRIAAAIGASRARSALAEIGVLQQTLLTRACEAIAEGAEQTALIVGGEARWRALCAAKAGIELEDDAGKEEMPDDWLQTDEEISSEIESERGLLMPVAAYAVVESAMRHARGLGIQRHCEEIASLVAAMSRVAAANEDAWDREERSAEQALSDDGGKNAMLAFPYAKLHASQWNVDQAAGLILCSAGAARRCGVAEERWIFPLSAAETNFMMFLLQREHLHRSPGARMAAEAALELAEISREELDFLELYSCFPAALQAHALELGLSLPLERPPTITGGMRFAGGPLNNYALQATVRMARCLRRKPGSAGLVSCVSGILNKHGFAVWASRAPQRPFRSRELARRMRNTAWKRRRGLQGDYQGRAKIAGYTVLHQQGRPTSAVAVCDLPPTERTVAQCSEPAVMERMMREEFCGRTVRIKEDATFTPLQ